MANYRNPSKRAMTETDFGLVADVACPAGVATQIGTFVVPAGTGLAAGYGYRSGQHDADGRWRAVINAAGPVLIPGLLQVCSFLPNGRMERILAEARTESLNANAAADRATWDPFPVVRHIVKFMGSVRLLLIPDAVALVGFAVSTIFIDMTLFEES